MGSRFAALDLSERLRPWHQLGVRFLWRGEGAREFAAETGSAQTAVAESQPARRVAPPPGVPVDQGHRPARGAAPRAQPRQPGEEAHPQATAETAASPGLAALHQGRAKAGAEPWPAPWDAHLQRIRKSAAVVFTYWDLALDLGSSPDPARRDLWRRMLKGLDWPQGTVAFWPVCAVESGSALAKPVLFWRGVAEIGADTVAVFGKRANLTLFPDRPYRHRSFLFGGLRVLVLPEPDELAAGDPAAKRVAWDALSGLQLR